MTTTRMKRLSPGFLNVNNKDHLPPKNRLRVQVVTNSKGYLELNLNGRDLRTIPTETFQLTATHVLRLAHNHIDNLPLMIAYLRMLKVLDLQHNLLASLPETLVNCRHLAELYLTANRLAELPKSIGGLKNVRVLTLGENQFEQLPQEVGLMTSLRILDLHSNKLWHLPFSLQELKHLIQLNASDNMFDHVPLVITKITSLQKLNLAKNRLASLPVDFDALRGLRELNLGHNAFVSISSLVTSFRHLKYLSLANNRLKFLPPQMSQLQNLRVLHVQHNYLRHVPSLLRCVQYYNVSSNQLTSFSVEGMRQLVSLTASCNNLDTVPRGLYKLKRLKFLYLDNNQLVELDEDIRQLKELRVLDVSSNQLVSLPRCLHKLAKLQSFNVKDNHKLKQPTQENGDPKIGTVDSASLKRTISRTKMDLIDHQTQTHEHKDSVNTFENRSDTLHEQSLMQMPKTPSDLEMYSKTNHSYRKGHQHLRGSGVAFPSSKIDSKRFKEHTQAGSYEPAEPGTTALKKVNSLQRFRHFLFGEPKKAKSARSHISGYDPSSNKLSEKSIHFQDNMTNTRDRSRRNLSATRHSTISRNSSSLRSQTKSPWAQSNGPAGSVHEVVSTNRIHFNIPDDRRHNVESKSDDSHGYGTWRSRRHAPDGYFDTESLVYSDNSSYGGQGHGQQTPSVHHNGVHKTGNEDYSYAEYRPSMDVFSSDELSYRDNGSRNQKYENHHTNKNTHQFYFNNDNASEGFRNEYINGRCHCSSLNNIDTWRGQGSGDSRRRNSFDRNSSASAYRLRPDRYSISEASVKATGKHGNQQRHGEPGFTSQAYTTQHNSFPESTMINSNQRMTIPHVGCWFRDKRANCQGYFNDDTGQLHGNCRQRGHSPPHVHHSNARDSSQLYQSDLTSDLEETNSLQNNHNYSYRTSSIQRQEKNTSEFRGKPKVEHEREHGAKVKQSFPDFDHVLMTKDVARSDIKQNGKAVQKNDTSNNYLHDRRNQENNVDNNVIKGRKINPTLSHSRSVDSLMDLASGGASFRKNARNRHDASGGAKNGALSHGFSELSLAHSDDAYMMDTANQSGTDYTLLGVCNQVETLLNRNLLQPVIGYHHRGRHSFAEKTIRENAQGLWRMDDSADPSTNNVNTDNVDDDDDDEYLPGLEYTQPQTFTVASKGGQFVSSVGPVVEISLPAHATAKPLHITVQLMLVPSAVIAKAKELNYFVNNIIAMGPVVYFHSAEDTKLNSPATITIPSPAEVKGGHLTVLTVRRDTSCIPCTTGYRSGKLKATFTTWYFVGKVALITQAKCKYKACKSMEQLLQCVGAQQI